MIGLQAEDGLLEGIDLEFLVDGFDVVSDGVIGKAELASDLFDRKSAKSGFKDHGFSNGQHLEGSVARGHEEGEESIVNPIRLRLATARQESESDGYGLVRCVTVLLDWTVKKHWGRVGLKGQRLLWAMAAIGQWAAGRARLVVARIRKTTLLAGLSGFGE